jgi:phage protein U
MIGSLTSGLLDNVKDIAVARVAALTPFIGMIGDVIFMSSNISVRTFQSLTRKTEAQFAEHSVIYKKPVSEFTGMSLDEFNFEVVLNGSLGVEPLTEYQLLKKMAESGNPHSIFLHGKREGDFTLRSVEGEETHWHKGRPIVMVVNMALREFIDSVPVNAEMKLREDELRRGDTGKGGPPKLPGTADKTPTQPRALTPKIDSVTRMVG